MRASTRSFACFGYWILMAGLSALTGTASAGVYDDCAAWWHFDYDPDADNLADLAEIRDQRDWDTAATKGATGKHATAIRGQAGGPRWVDTPDAAPAGGQNYGRKSMLFQTAIDPVTLTNCWPDTFLVSNLQLPGAPHATCSNPAPFDHQPATNRLRNQIASL